MNATTVRASPGILDVELKGETIVLTPVVNLGELDFEEIEASGKDVFGLMSQRAVRNAIVDFHRTDFCGSTALSFLIRLWKQVRNRNGRLVLCNLSDHEKEILRITKLDGMWPICSSLDEALQLCCPTWNA
jgi:anti-anti-sigma factor